MALRPLKPWIGVTVDVGTAPYYDQAVQAARGWTLARRSLELQFVGVRDAAKIVTMIQALQTDVPGARWVPGVKLHNVDSPVGNTIDDPAVWQEIADTVDALVSALGVQHVVLEAETFFNDYTQNGIGTPNFAQMQQGMALLRGDCTYELYPGVRTQTGNPIQDRTVQVCQTFANAHPGRTVLVQLLWGAKTTPDDPIYIDAALVARTIAPITLICYCYDDPVGRPNDWRPADLQDLFNDSAADEHVGDGGARPLMLLGFTFDPPNAYALARAYQEVYDEGQTASGTRAETLTLVARGLAENADFRAFCGVSTVAEAQARIVYAEDVPEAALPPRPYVVLEWVELRDTMVGLATSWPGGRVRLGVCGELPAALWTDGPAAQLAKLNQWQRFETAVRALRAADVGPQRLAVGAVHQPEGYGPWFDQDEQVRAPAERYRRWQGALELSIGAEAV